MASFSVLITRPQAQADVWAAQLTELGFHNLWLGLLEIRPLMDEAQTRAIKNRILDFDLYHKVIFVSQNAVDYGLGWLEDYWPQLPTGIAYFAVGATTAKKLADYGIAVTDLASCASGGMTSEDLLQAPQLQQVEGEKILICRGLGGRGQLADILRARGAQVDYCELYERRLPVQALDQWQDFVSQAEGRWVISLHSGESLQNLQQLLTQMAPEAQCQALQFLQSQWLLVPSERLVASAKAAGFTQVVCADNATDAAMTRALLQLSNTD